MADVLIGDVFNLLNRQAITDRSISATTSQSSGDLRRHPGGDLQRRRRPVALPGATLNPVAQLANPAATATNPDFLKAGARWPPASARLPAGYTGQRTLRLGVKAHVLIGGSVI